MKFGGFIVGPERSGTTLTSAYLSSHESLYVINDPHYLNFFFETLIQARLSDSLGPDTSCTGMEVLLDMTLKRVLDWYTRWEEFKGDPVDLDKFIVSHSYLIQKGVSLQEYFHKFHLSLVPENLRYFKKTYVVKIPDLARYYNLMASMYHRVPIVFNIRHPVCNVASIIEPNYDRGWDFQTIIDWYKCFFPPIVMNKMLPNTLMTRYEDLIYFDKENTLANILAHFGMSSDISAMPTDYTYPNQKVMRKTKGKVDPGRMTKSLELMTPYQMMQTLEQTAEISDLFYSDLSLTKILDAAIES